MPSLKARHTLTVFLYTASILTSAFLLFYLQPLIAKMLLPYLGGSPAVWNICMVFFQALLLAGYAYAHILPAVVGVRRHALIHVALILAAALSLPFGISAAAVESLSSSPSPYVWLLATLFGTVGLPFFAVSTNGPLLQKWFSLTPHPRARDPYFLYSASNLGSLLALLGYPLLLEPGLGLRRQAGLWTVLFAVLVVSIFACAVMLWRSGKPVPDSDVTDIAAGGDSRPVNAARRVWWVTLAFVPSSLMLGVTSYLTTDLTPIPLLWVLPLALYLFTFVLAFSGGRFRQRKAVQRYALPILAGGVVFTLVMDMNRPLWFLMLLHLLFFFVAALFCHLRLADDRPEANRLTEFYLWLAVGGVLGGLFNALAAPLLFSRVIEYPLVIILVCLLRPHSRPDEDKASSRLLDFVAPVVLGLCAGGATFLIQRQGGGGQWLFLAFFIVLVVAYLLVERPTRFALSLGAVLLAGGLVPRGARETLRTERNFFGVLRVVANHDTDTTLLFHGSTLHGAQFADPNLRCEPTTYYHRLGPLGAIFENYKLRPASPNVAVIGLGAGTTAAYAAAGQNWTYYEIDQAVIRIARDEGFFHYLKDCAASPPSHVVGDARLRIAEAPEGFYGLIVVDAFSSDAIPVHLMTREALRLYMSKLAPDGTLAMHVTNRHLDLVPVLSSIARVENLQCLAKLDKFKEGGGGRAVSRWVAISRTPEVLESLKADQGWQRQEVYEDQYLWTDDYSNVFSVYKW
jgi:hypothetical protein